MKRLFSFFLFFVISLHSNIGFSLDKDGKFESPQELDAYVVSILKKMAKEFNEQTPIQVNEYTRLVAVIALQKQIIFNYSLNQKSFDEVDPQEIKKFALENLMKNACETETSRILISIGVVYSYVYYSMDGELITQVSTRNRKCPN